MVDPHDEEMRKRALFEWASSRYAILAVDVSVAHTDEDLANIATHHPSGDAFSWDEFNNINFITCMRHSVDFGLKLASTNNNRAEFTAKGQKWTRIADILEDNLVIYFTNSATSGTTVLLELEGW